MALKSIGEQSAKTNFVNATAGVVANVAKVKPKLSTLDDPTDNYGKILLFGDYGSGKTFAIVGLLLEGLTVLVITTDIGGDGLASVRAELNRIGRQDLKKKIISIVLETHNDVVGFFKDPDSYWSDGVGGVDSIWDAGIDLVFFDGFTGYQMLQLYDDIEATDTGILNNDGSVDTQRFWGSMKRETGRALNRFLGFHNRKTGQKFHKMMTCLDTSTMTDAQALSATSTGDAAEKRKRMSVKESIGPFVQGSAAKLIGPAFDLVIYTNAKTVLEGEKQVARFTYQTMRNDKLRVKSRGVNLDSLIIDPKKLILRADMQEVWRSMCRDLDIVSKAPVAEEVTA